MDRGFIRQAGPGPAEGEKENEETEHGGGGCAAHVRRVPRVPPVEPRVGSVERDDAVALDRPQGVVDRARVVREEAPHVNLEQVGQTRVREAAGVVVADGEVPGLVGALEGRHDGLEGGGAAAGGGVGGEVDDVAQADAELDAWAMRGASAQPDTLQSRNKSSACRRRGAGRRSAAQTTRNALCFPWNVLTALSTASRLLW